VPIIIDSSDVSIGTTGGGAKLNVQGNVNFDLKNSTDNLFHYIGAESPTGDTATIANVGAYGVGFITGSDSLNTQAFFVAQPNGNIIMQSNAGNGNVGIGTSSPAAKLHVNGSFQVDTSWTLNKTTPTTSTYFYSEIAGGFTGTYSNSDNNRGGSIHLKETGALISFSDADDNSNTSLSINNNIYNIVADNGSGQTLGISGQHNNIRFVNEAVELGVITHDGDWGIGTSTPTEKLDVDGSAKIDSALIITPTTAADTAYTIPNSVSKVVLAYGSAQATGTITLPAAPKEGQHLAIYVKTGSVTALVVNLNGNNWGDGFTAPTSIDGNTPIKLYFTDGYWLKN
jgi:hypothetical protein